MRFFHEKFFLLTVFAALTMFTGLGSRELFSGDETRTAGIIAEMTISGDMITPRLNGRPFLEYPPLYYQTGSVFFRLFGVTDAAAKLPSAVCTFGAALLAFALARRMKLTSDAALAAGIMLLTGIQSFFNSRKCMVDAMLAFFVLLSIYGFHSLTAVRDRRKQFAFFLLYSAGLAGGFMTKGLIGFAFPWAGLGTWLVADDLFFEKRFSFRRYLLLGLGVFPALIPVLYWLYRLYLAGGSGPIETVLIENGLGRFTGAQGDHIENMWYYLIKLPTLFQPWLAAFLASLIYAGHLIRKKRLARETLPLLCESVAPFILLSCASSKRQVYLLPIYSSWALLTAWFLIDNRRVWLEWAKRLPLPVVKNWRWILVVATAVALTVFFFLASAWAKAIPVAALLALAITIFCPRRRIFPALATAALLFVCLDTVILARRNRKESLRPLFEECRSLENQGYLIRLDRSAPERTKGAAVFYLKKRMPEIENEAPFGAHEKRIIRDKASRIGKKFADGQRLLDATDVAL